MISAKFSNCYIKAQKTVVHGCTAVFSISHKFSHKNHCDFFNSVIGFTELIVGKCFSKKQPKNSHKFSHKNSHKIV